MCIYYVAYLVLADQSDTIDHEFSSRITKCESKDEFYARILHDERSRQKRRPRWWSLLNNSSIRRDYGSTIWSPSSDRRRFPLEEPSDFRILDSFGDFITRGWRIKKKRKDAHGTREANWTGKVFNLFMLPSCPHPQLGSSSVSSDLIVLLSSSLHPATRFSLYLLAWNFPLFEIERIVGGWRKKEWPIEYATADCIASGCDCSPVVCARCIRMLRRDSLLLFLFFF